MKTGKTAGG